MAEKEGGGEGNDPGTASFEITVGEGKQVVTPKDVEAIMAKQGELTATADKAAAVLSGIKRFKVTPEEFLSHAEGSFSTLGTLVEQGVIDAAGNLLIDPSKMSGDDDPGDGDDDGLDPNLFGEDKSGTAIVKAVLKKLEPTLKGLEGIGEIGTRLDGIEKDQMIFTRNQIAQGVMKKHPNLDQTDVSRALGIASHDRSKNVWEVAEEISKTKTSGTEKIRRDTLKEAGFDPDEFDANKLLEDDPASGTAAIFLKERRPTFKKGTKGGETPLAMATAFLAGKNRM